MKAELTRDASKESYVIEVFAPIDTSGLLYNLDFVGYEKVGSQYHLNRVNMDNFMLTYIRNGTINLIYKDKFYHHDKECLIFLDCLPEHEVWTGNEGCELFFIHFNNPHLNSFFKYIYSTVGPLIPLNKDELSTYNNILKIHDLVKQGSYNEKEVSRIIYEILTIIKDKIDREFINLSSIPEYINYLIKYISNNYQKKMNLKEYANLVNITPNYLDFAFKKYTGSSLGKYISDLRFRKAVNLLKNSKKNLTEIAQEIGLEDSQTLIRLFKKTIDMTPSQYRKEDRSIAYFGKKKD